MLRKLSLSILKRTIERRHLTKNLLALAIYSVRGGFSRSRAAPTYLFSLPATLNVPFQASEKGAEATGSLRVPVKDGYNFYIHIECKNDREEINRVQGLVGVRHIDQYGGLEETSHSLALPVRLKIIEISNSTENTILDHEYFNERIDSWSNCQFWNLITGLQLDKGDYRVSLEVLRANNEFRGLRIALDVHVPYRS